MSMNSTSPTWESDKMLNVYIYDYCIKRNFKDAARAFFVEAKVPQDQQVPINARDGFLYEWWTVFWDIFSARANRTGSQDALAYVDIQHDKVFNSNSLIESTICSMEKNANDDESK